MFNKLITDTRLCNTADCNSKQQQHQCIAVLKSRAIRSKR